MAEYITRDETFKAIIDALADERSVFDAINDIPAADVREVKRGRWIWKENGEVVCSECNNLVAVVGNTEDLATVKADFNYCPNCGADMRRAE